MLQTTARATAGNLEKSFVRAGRKADRALADWLSLGDPRDLLEFDRLAEAQQDIAHRIWGCERVASGEAFGS